MSAAVTSTHSMQRRKTIQSAVRNLKTALTDFTLHPVARADGLFALQPVDVPDRRMSCWTPAYTCPTTILN